MLVLYGGWLPFQETYGETWVLPLDSDALAWEKVACLICALDAYRPRNECGVAFGYALTCLGTHVGSKGTPR